MSDEKIEVPLEQLKEILYWLKTLALQCKEEVALLVYKQASVELLPKPKTNEELIDVVDYWLRAKLNTPEWDEIKKRLREMEQSS